MSNRSAQHFDAVHTNLSPWIYVSENTFIASTWSSSLMKDSRGRNAEVYVIADPVTAVKANSLIDEVRLTQTGLRASIRPRRIAHGSPSSARRTTLKR